MKTRPSLTVHRGQARGMRAAEKHQLSLNCHVSDAGLSYTSNNSAIGQSPFRNGASFMRHALGAALLATSMFSLPATAHAQAMSAEEAAALHAELAALRTKVETLEARLDQASPPPVATPAPAPAPAPEASATQIKWKGAPEINRRRLELQAARPGSGRCRLCRRTRRDHRSRARLFERIAPHPHGFRRNDPRRLRI